MYKPQDGNVLVLRANGSTPNWTEYLCIPQGWPIPPKAYCSGTPFPHGLTQNVGLQRDTQ